LLLGRRAHAIDATAAGATVLASEEGCATAPSGSALQRARRPPRLGSSGPRTLVVSFDQRGRPIVSGPARLGSDADKAACQRRAQIAADQAVRLGAQELRPAGADPPRRWPQARAAQHARDRGGRDADPQPFSSPWMRM
jgi:hypothetical protein